MESIKLKGGALIIGSLLWQDDLKPEVKDAIRKKWRDEHLIENTIKINLPIRYGRLSMGGIFTMVFSKNCEKEKLFGTGYVKAFKNDQINSWEELESLAIEMSKAEGMNGKFIGGNRDIWCTMSILFNPNKIVDEEKKYIIEKWKNKIAENGGGSDLGDYKFGDEESAINDNCTLNFNWFDTVLKEEKTKLNDLDFIICTVTKQKNLQTNNYPTIYELADAVRNDKARKYFKNNVANGISTFEDKLVEEELKKEGSHPHKTH